MDIQDYLESKGCEVTVRGDSNISTHCMFCEEEDTKPGRLYINVDEYDETKCGLFFCFLCQEKGHVNRIREHFGDAPIKSDLRIKDDPIYEVATRYYENQLLDNMNAYKFLIEDRGLNEETIKKARLGWADGGLQTHLIKEGFDVDHIKSSGLVKDYGDYFNNEITIPYLEYGVAVDIRGKKMGGKYRSMSNHKGRLYGTDSIIGEDTVNITEGELCAMHLQQLGFPAVGVPGAQTWKKEWNDLLEEAKRVYIMYDSDKAGESGAQKAAGNIGPRSRVVELPIKKIDIEDYIIKYGKGYDDIEYLMRKATGGLLVTVREAYEQWTEIEGNPDLAGLKFNITFLDKAMPLGMLPGQVVTMLSRTNSGKTIWSINLFQRMKMVKPDIKILFISLEQTRNEWFHRAYHIMNAYEPGASVIDTINYWENNLLIVDKNSITEEQLKDTIEQYSYELGQVPDFICIDYMGYYARPFVGTQIEKITQAVMGMKAIAKEFQTVVYAPAQANRTNTLGERVSMDQSKDSSTIEETSDCQLGLWRPDQNPDSEEQPGSVMQEILKSRGGTTGDVGRYMFGPMTLAMVPTDDPAVDRIHFERQCMAAGDNFYQFINRLKSGDLTI